MAKRKTRRSRPSAVVETTNSESSETSSKSRRATTAEQFQQEYAYVLKDLRLVFVLAGIMFALLILLNLVLG